MFFFIFSLELYLYMQFFCDKLLYVSVFFALILRVSKIETRIAL